MSARRFRPEGQTSLGDLRVTIYCGGLASADLASLRAPALRP